MGAYWLWLDKPENLSREEVEALLKEYDKNYNEYQKDGLEIRWDDTETPELGIWHVENGEPVFIRSGRIEAFLLGASILKGMS